MNYGLSNELDGVKKKLTKYWIRAASSKTEIWKTGQRRRVYTDYRVTNPFTNISVFFEMPKDRLYLYFFQAFKIGISRGYLYKYLSGDFFFFVLPLRTYF